MKRWSCIFALVLIISIFLYGCGTKPRYEVHTERYYVADGSQDFTMTHSFKANGNRMETYTVGYPRMVHYVYNQEGWLLEERGNECGTPFVIQYEYDSKGNTVKKTAEYSGEYSSVTIYTYSGENITVEETTLDNGVSQKIEYDYDSWGNLTRVKKTYNTTSSAVMTYEEIENNRDGYKIKSTEYDANGELTGRVITYQYDKAGNLIEELGYQNGELLYGREYTYIEIPQ